MKNPRIALAALVFMLFIKCASLAAAPAQVAAPASPHTSASPIQRPIRDKWALIVGIGNFQDDKIPHLQYSTKDARDFRNYLVNEGNFASDHVRILIDKDATQRRIMSELGSKFLARMAKPDDLVVLFFSTHGSPSQMDPRGQNYLVAYDSDPQDLYSSGIEMQKILESIRGRVLSDRVVLLMDACHSGNVDPNAKGMYRSANFDADALAEGSGQLVICSSKPDEQSWESRRYQNGVFTHNLLQGLRNGGTDVPLQKAFEQMKGLVADEVRQDRPGAHQTPVMRTKWEGSDLILAVKPSAAEPLPQTVVQDLPPDSLRVIIGAKSMPATSGPSPLEKPTLDDLPKPLPADPPPPAAPLVVTIGYFGNDPNPQKAYTEACAQQDAHFNDPWFYFRKAKLQIQMKNYAKAEQELKGLIVDDPNDSDYYIAHAYCYHKMKKETAAQDEIARAKFKNPTLPDKIEFGD